jgi:ABC-type polysaccharide transport system permease subunit
MNGVEILSSAEVACEFAFNWTSFWITFGIILGAFVCVSIWKVVDGSHRWQLIPSFAVIGIVAGIIVGSSIGYGTRLPVDYETHYKVTIDDSVSMNDFLDKYEILDQEGKIYTVKERK